MTLLFISIAVCCLALSLAISQEAALIDSLLKDYYKQGRPVKNHREPVRVSFRLTLLRFDELDLRKEQLSVTGWTELIWLDEYLTWNRTVNDVKHLVIQATDIWLPDLAVMNSVKGVFQDYSQFQQYKVMVCNKGRVRWVPADNYAVSCNVDITYFPFDRQTCYIIFTSWHYSVEQVVMYAEERTIDTLHYEEDGEWILENAEILDDTTPYPDHGPELFANFSYIRIKITINRRPMYYIINILVPCLMLAGLVMVIFFLPPDSGEKISLGITVLLSFSVFQLLIAENVPTSSTSTPLLAVYLLCIMAASTSSIAVSVLVLNLHHRTVYSHPPQWLRVVVLKHLARILCMHNGFSLSSVHPFKPKLSPKTKFEEPAESNGKFRMVVEEPDGDGEYPKITVSEEKFEKDASEHSPKDLQKPRHVIIRSTGSDTDRDAIEAKQTVKASSSLKLSKEIPGVPTKAYSERSLSRKRSSQHTLSASATRSAVRIIRSIAHLDQSTKSNKSTSQQEFIDAVRDVERVLMSSREAVEMEHLLENEWKSIARVVDRFFFWCTFFSLCVTTIIVTCYLQAGQR